MYARRRRRHALGCLLAACLVAGAGRAAEPAAYAPDFTRTDLAGQVQALSRYRGRVVLLSFWATWCEPCLDELPAFTEWQRRYGPAGLQVLAVSLDDDAAPVRRALARAAAHYPVVMGDPELYRLYGGVLGLPLSYLIDPAGRVVARLQGEPDLARLEHDIQSLLAHSAR